MALQVTIEYRNHPVVYQVTKQEDEIYQLRLHDDQNNSGDNYIPQKMTIRKKGKIWVSDLEDYRDLVSSLTTEITQFSIDK